MSLSEFKKNGKFLMLALDHRGSFQKLVNAEHPENVKPQQAARLKADIINALYDQFSGVLIDQEYGLMAYNDFCTNNAKPFLLPLEESGYTEVCEGERITNLKYSATDLIDMGALAAKVLIYFNPHVDSCGKQLSTSRLAVKQCKDAQLPLFFEIVTYANGHSTGLVVESVRKFIESEIIPDVFKLEYPGSREECMKISGMLNKINVPWILLTRGGDFEVFCKQLQDATDAGCIGFLAGRSLWQEYPSMTNERAEKEFLENTLPDRFTKIANIVLN